MNRFEKYLLHKNYSVKTVATYCKYQVLFERWLSDENYRVSELKHRHILAFIQKLSAEGKSKKHINMHLTILRHYFNCLVQQQKVKDNVAQGIVVKGISRRLPHHLLSKQQLDDMYENYALSGSVSQRNKVLLSLMIYQGLGTREIKNLMLNHVHLEQGTIEISGSKKSNYRVMVLEGKQIMLMHQYISQHRESILQFNNKQSDTLIVSIGKSELLQNTINYLIMQLKKEYPFLININQIRISVISEWLKTENLRKVQYLCGHRFVSSTERYQQHNLDDLKNEVQHYHPMK